MRWLLGARGFAAAAVLPFSSPATINNRTKRSKTIQTLASHPDNSSSSPPPPRVSRRKNGSPKRKQPSVAEVQRAIGVAGDPLSTSGGNPSPSVLDLLASTPIGQAEGSTEKKLREAAEWMVDRTEARARSGQQILLVVCVKILPVWLFLLLVASGVINLPFNLPFMDDLIT